MVAYGRIGWRRCKPFNTNVSEWNAFSLKLYFGAELFPKSVQSVLFYPRRRDRTPNTFRPSFTDTYINTIVRYFAGMTGTGNGRKSRTLRKNTDRQP